MLTLRRALAILGLLILIASLILLVAANLPNERTQERQQIPPEQLTLPTPEAAAPLAPHWAGACLGPVCWSREAGL